MHTDLSSLSKLAILAGRPPPSLIPKCASSLVQYILHTTLAQYLHSDCYISISHCFQINFLILILY